MKKSSLEGVSRNFEQDDNLQPRMVARTIVNDNLAFEKPSDGILELPNNVKPIAKQSRRLASKEMEECRRKVGGKVFVFGVRINLCIGIGVTRNNFTCLLLRMKTIKN